MRKKWICCAAVLVSIWLAALPVHAVQLLIPVGEAVGLELDQEQPMVAAFDDKIDAAQKAGVQIGDRILAVDGKKVSGAEDIRQELRRSQGTVRLEVRRGDKTRSLRVKPVITADGPMLGIFLRSGVTGIGTVTWYDPETGQFGSLGHGVNDQNGELVPFTAGSVYSASISSVKKGQTGEPGQLRGAVDGTSPLGKLRQNTVQGVFGKADTGWLGEPIPVADVDQIHTGPAIIRSTVEGSRAREYTVEIRKLYRSSGSQGRNMLIEVTDPALLEATGGIVQGMSGSPIIQDGRLVGAVTHVLINDPRTGYGIFIENMLDAAA